MRYIIVLVAFFLPYPLVSTADNKTDHQLAQRIQALQAQMHDTRTQYGRLQKQLQKIEEEVGEIALRLEILKIGLDNKQQALINLRKKLLVFNRQLKSQRQILAKQIRAAYIMGHQDYLKLWLNQENPFSIGRTLKYYDYFNNSKARQIANTQAILQRLTVLKQRIVFEEADFSQLFRENQYKKRALEVNYKVRKKILVQLANSFETQAKALKGLLKDKQQLETLIGTLGNTLKNLQKRSSFAQLKGKLPYPVRGRKIKQFGDALVGSLKWQGLLIAAPNGKKIRVIASGRVAFAQWFRHFGLLIIIDHGEGYMSLYGHNQSLYVRAGDWVKANDIIATVGHSGGSKISALYLEIRHNGVAQSPQKWLR